MNVFDETDRKTQEIKNEYHLREKQVVAYREVTYWLLTIAQFYIGTILYLSRHLDVPAFNYTLAQLSGYGVYGVLWLVVGVILLLGKAIDGEGPLLWAHRVAVAFFVAQTFISIAGFIIEGPYSAQNLPWWIIAGFLHYRASLGLPLLPRFADEGYEAHVAD